MDSNIVRLLTNNVIEAMCAKKVKVKKSRKPKIKLKKAVVIAQREIESIEVVDTDACASIWQSVVVQAFYDLISEAENS